MEKVAINPTIEPPDLTQDWGDRLSEGTKRTLCEPGPRNKEERPHETESDLPTSVRQRRGSAVACCSVRALSAEVHAWDLLKEVDIIFITSIIVWTQVKQQGGSRAPPINRKLD